MPSSIRKAPAPREVPAEPKHSTVPSAPESPAARPPAPAPSPVDEPPTFLSSPKRPVEPLSPGRYHVNLTVGEETLAKLRRLQDLIRRELPGGDLDVIFDRGVDLQLAEAERKAFAATTRPRPRRPEATRGSRDPSAHVRRAVWERDEGRCAFVGPKGRCSERSFLEFHHVNPHGHGGKPTQENISLRCRAHNVYESERIFGPFDPSIVRESAPAYE